MRERVSSRSRRPLFVICTRATRRSSAVRLPLDQALVFQPADGGSDRRRLHSLELGELTQGQRAPALDRGQRGRLGGRDAGVRLLAQPAGEARDDQPEPVGEGGVGLGALGHHFDQLISVSKYSG